MPFLTFSQQRRAVAYYRHSAEDKQENSVTIQRDHAKKFAALHNVVIIHEEADEGKSGLSADRVGFQNLFNNWILNDRAPPFEYVLVYDVSRWGRFQNPDEGAMYQYQCAQRGKRLIFVDKGKLEEEQALVSHLHTAIERYMAAEYSRQLSSKVFHGAAKVSQQGFSAGGSACYGMSRLLLDANKQPIRILKAGEHKQISNERVTFTPSNDATTQTVMDVFKLCAERSYSPHKIAADLNKKHIPSPREGQWNRTKILRILRNETYTGTRVYNKRWGRLKEKSRRNPRSEWITCPNAFPAIISREIFEKAQENLKSFVVPRLKKPEHAIRKLKQHVSHDVQNFLKAKNIDENDVLPAVRNFPITVSIEYTRHGNYYWCFTVSEQMKNFDFVFAVGLSVNVEGKLPKVFCIPTSAFEKNNFLIFSRSEKEFSGFSLSNDQVEAKFRQQLDKLVVKLSSRNPVEIGKN